MAKHKTPLRKRDPDMEAHTATIEADTIGDPKRFRRSSVHHAGRTEATGNVIVRIRKQFPNSDGNSKRPEEGSVFEGDKVEIQSRKVTVTKSDGKSARDRATASMGVWFFGKLRRRP